ncbi:Asp23/Gls24 family envelope stress response protein [Apilactobacillus sp. M161]|uniref:Asp23/Gls24 family envelope stress response protein n=1 Tax=Apilactobacillus xinyiensis TaxID=2841032 RepID=A0ABT0I169_9LACO|nr:Asp23/Gls24 family envelope stress response protein [Apilactobacillus xinyiensis]MCK8624159.1 Asp23/Gls24 family envelope stress response protein [Apilactobacillus xinyiensis]
MAVKIKTKYGIVDIKNDVISTVVGAAVTNNYGIVGMASKNQIRDNVNVILGKDNYSKGVVVKQNHDNEIFIEVNVIVIYGIKISEVSRSVQSKVKYNLETMLGIKASVVNVVVQGVKVINE